MGEAFRWITFAGEKLLHLMWYTVDAHYLDYSLSRTFAVSNFFAGLLRVRDNERRLYTFTKEKTSKSFRRVCLRELSYFSSNSILWILSYYWSEFTTFKLNLKFFTGFFLPKMNEYFRTHFRDFCFVVVNSWKFLAKVKNFSYC